MSPVTDVDAEAAYYLYDWLELVNLDHSFVHIWAHYFPMKRKLSPKQMLAVRCPTCGAAPGKKCELATGQPRFWPHRDRRLIAAD